MGLDIALGGVILIAAIRGYFKGFLLQAIGLIALVACVYAADPVRDLARPYARELFPSIEAGLLDRLLWWSSAVASFVMMSGMAGWVVRSRRRRFRRDDEPDQGRSGAGAGFLLGALKGLVTAAFLAAGVLRYAPSRVEPGGAFASQLNRSIAIAWAEKYRPAEQIWASRPVQAVLAHIRARGFGDLEAAPVVATEDVGPAPALVVKPEPPKAVQADRQAPSLRIPRRIAPESRARPGSAAYRRDLDEQIRRLGIDPLPDPENSDG